MQIREHDCVRLLTGFTGPNICDPGDSTMLAGAEGCAIAVFWDACMVEFDNEIVLTIPISNLVKYWDAATQKPVTI